MAPAFASVSLWPENVFVFPIWPYIHSALEIFWRNCTYKLSSTYFRPFLCVWQMKCVYVQAFFSLDTVCRKFEGYLRIISIIMLMIPFNALTVLVRQQEGYLQIKIQIQNDLLEMQQVCIQSDMKIHLWNSRVIGDPSLVYAEYTFTHSWAEIFFFKFYSNHTLDATKAFDRVNYVKLFCILVERALPSHIIRVLIICYSASLFFLGRQCLCLFSST